MRLICLRVIPVECLLSHTDGGTNACAVLCVEGNVVHPLVHGVHDRNNHAELRRRAGEILRGVFKYLRAADAVGVVEDSQRPRAAGAVI